MNNLIKIDCFSFIKKNKIEYCDCLKNLECEKGSCKFYKRKEEIKNAISR